MKITSRRSFISKAWFFYQFILLPLMIFSTIQYGLTSIGSNPISSLKYSLSIALLYLLIISLLKSKRTTESVTFNESSIGIFDEHEQAVFLYENTSFGFRTIDNQIGSIPIELYALAGGAEILLMERKTNRHYFDVVYDYIGFKSDLKQLF